VSWISWLTAVLRGWERSIFVAIRADSPVCCATWTGDLLGDKSSPAGANGPDRLWVHPSFYSKGTDILSLGITRGRREFDHSHPSSAKVKNEQSHTSTPHYMPSWCGQGQLYLFSFIFNQATIPSCLSSGHVFRTFPSCLQSNLLLKTFSHTCKLLSCLEQKQPGVFVCIYDNSCSISTPHIHHTEIFDRLTLFPLHVKASRPHVRNNVCATDPV
jgi:hypothetical protein